MDVLVRIFCIYFFPFAIVAYLFLEVGFIPLSLPSLLRGSVYENWIFYLVVVFVCIPTEDGWERAKISSVDKNLRNESIQEPNRLMI